MKFADYFRQDEPELWRLMKQCGVDYAVGRLPETEDGSMPVSLSIVQTMKERFAETGLKLEVIEPVPPMEKVKQGLVGRDEEIERLHGLIKIMGQLEIPVLCYNFMASFGWGRTDIAVPTRGGALVSGYDHAVMEARGLTDAGEISEDHMWENYEYFIKATIPVAEEAGVKLAMHPDDPPLSPVRGVARILSSKEGFDRALSLVESDNHGITFCQGNFTAMGCDIPETIKHFGKKIFFVHFRDVEGTPEKFVETFHDNGPHDMAAAMNAYAEIGFNGPIRSDHVPTMYGEANTRPGYMHLGRLFAMGYMKGLWEQANR